MPLPWLQIIDAVIGVANFVSSRRSAAGTPVTPVTAVTNDLQQLDAAARAPGGLEARMAGVVVAALKEAFDRDTKRVELEREQLAVQRETAERALRMEARRQAGDREIARLRLLAVVAAAAWLVTLLLSIVPGSRGGGGLGARVALGAGWLLLGVAIAASFSAQARVSAAVDATAARFRPGPEDAAIASGAAGTATLWLVVCGLVLIGLAALIA